MCVVYTCDGYSQFFPRLVTNKDDTDGPLGMGAMQFGHDKQKMEQGKSWSITASNGRPFLFL